MRVRNLVWRLVSVYDPDEKAQPVSAIARRGYQEMRIKDALKALIRKKERGSLIPMETVWTQQADDENQVPLPEYPRPQLKRASWMCLNGWWEYAFTGTREVPRRPDGRILVPFSPETSRSGVGRTLHPGEALWYRREIDPAAVPALNGRKKGARLLLHFGAVDERCTVWWNRHRLGRHRGGYLPFTFDVTDFLREGKSLYEAALNASQGEKKTGC